MTYRVLQCIKIGSGFIFGTVKFSRENFSELFSRALRAKLLQRGLIMLPTDSVMT